jgi:UDP-glucose 4-epimerase
VDLLTEMPTDSYILVVGGAGYIGSHMVLKLQAKGFKPLVLDNFSTGHRHAVAGVEWIEGDCGDQLLLERIFASLPILAVMHFASCIEVGESVRHPGKYYHNNVANTLNLLSALENRPIKAFIFSSSAAVYGEPQYTPIDETHPLLPLNPYGRSKLMVEQMLQDFEKSQGLRYMALRYFNAAGADPQSRVGEEHPHESHLIPLVLQAALAQRPFITVYGRDYPTADGSCIRDYVHVDDLCEAHLLALQALLEGAESKSYNLGTGYGYSVLEVIRKAEQVTKTKIPIQEGQRRPGDPAVLVADPQRAMHDLAWQPQYPDLSMMIKHSWNFASACSG